MSLSTEAQPPTPQKDDIRRKTCIRKCTKADISVSLGNIQKALDHIDYPPCKQTHWAYL